MKHYHIICSYEYNNCINCNFLKECFPKTYKKRQLELIKKQKDKYEDDFK